MSNTIKIKSYERKLPKKSVRKNRATKGASSKWKKYYGKELKNCERRVAYARQMHNKYHDKMSLENLQEEIRERDKMKRKLRELE
jgi:hypothetical protein